jgi:hypothetical protein
MTVNLIVVELVRNIEKSVFESLSVVAKGRVRLAN